MRQLFRTNLVCSAVLVLSGLAFPMSTASGQDLTIAAASDLQPVLPAIAERFRKETGHRVGLTFGSSGNFSAQIQNGAPFDLFFSADVDYATRLVTGGHADAGSLFRYAIGRIVLWSRKDSGIDVTRGLGALGDSRVRRLSIANPEHAPYGRAAVAALQHEKLYEGVKSKLVFGESVSQAAQFVQSGNAEAGIIALSLALTPALRQSGTHYEIPASFHPALEQAAVITSGSRRKELARQFLAFVNRPDIGRLLQEFGFTRPVTNF